MACVRVLSEGVCCNFGYGREGQKVRILSSNRSETDMCILEIGPCVTFERQHTIPVKGVLVDSGRITLVTKHRS